MSRHEVTIHENATRTQGAAPYLGTYLSKETVRNEKFAAVIAAKSGLPAIQVQAVLDGCFEAIEELEKDALVRIHLDGLSVMGVITGTFPASNSPFDPERNRLLPVIQLDEAIRFSLTDETPAILTAADLTRLRIDNVADVASPRPYNLIHGTKVFRVAGFNMVHTDAGSAAYLQNSLGVTFPLVVDEVVSKQLFTAHLAAALEPGDYRLVVKSRAGDAEGPLQTAFKKVKVMTVEEPEAEEPDDEPEEKEEGE